MEAPAPPQESSLNSQGYSSSDGQDLSSYAMNSSSAGGSRSSNVVARSTAGSLKSRKDDDEDEESRSAEVTAGAGISTEAVSAKAESSSGSRPRVDVLSPLVKIASAPASVAETDFSVEFSATDDSGVVSYFECRLNSELWARCESPVVYSDLDEGAYAFAVRAADKSGNVSVAVQHEWKVDLTAPVLTMTSVPALMSNSLIGVFGLHGDDGVGSGILRFECSQDGVLYSECPAMVSMAVTSGARTLTARAIDKVGHESLPVAYSWVVDIIAPTLNLTSVPNVLTNSTSATFDFLGSDTGGSDTIAGYFCSVDSASYASCVPGVSYAALAAGAKTFDVYAVDGAGNTSIVSRHLWKIDIEAPVVSWTKVPAVHSNENPTSFEFSAADTGGGVVTGFECRVNSGAVAACSSPFSTGALGDAAHSFAVRAFDSAGNVGAFITHSWSLDTSIPVLTVTTPAANNQVIPAASVANFTFAGSCSEEGRAVSLSGAVAAATTCTAGAWTVSLDLHSLTDGPVAIVVSQTDVSGNTATASRTVLKDTTAPQISLGTVAAKKGGDATGLSWTMTEYTAPAGSNFQIDIFDGSSWSAWGSKAATAGVNSAVAYTASSLTVPVLNTTHAQVRVSFTDAAGNHTAVTSSDFLIDSLGPVVGSVTVNSGDGQSSNNNIAIAASVTDVLSRVLKVCTKNTSVQPLVSDGCWVNLASYGVTPAQSISTSDIYHNVGLASGSYNVHVWFMDEVGNISPAGGNSGVVTYNSPTPPLIENLQVSSTDTPSVPLSSTDLMVGAGQSIYVKWKVSSTSGLGSAPVKISYSVDDLTYSGGPASALANAANGACALTGGFTGCAVLPAPQGTYFKTRVEITDTKGFISVSVSNSMNAGAVRFVAGSTDLGLGASAKSAILQPESTNGIAVLDDGRMFLIDTRGLTWVNQATGVYEVIAKKTGTTSGDGGALASATFTTLTGIYVDNNNNLLIVDGKRVRRVNTKLANLPISTIIGGGTDGADSVAVATNFLAPNNIGRMFISPNGDIVFRTDGTNGKLRKYTAATGVISAIQMKGTGNTFSASQNVALCAWQDYAVAFKPTGEIERLLWKVESTGLTGNCPFGSTAEWKGYAQVDPATGDAMLPAPDWIVPSAQGRREYSNFYNNKNGDLIAAASSSASSSKAVYKFDTTTLKWTTLYGKNVHGTCDEGTDQDKCAIAVSSLSFNSQGQIFYVDAKNRTVRTIDADSKIRNLAGDPLGSPDGIQPALARFADITDVKEYVHNGIRDFYVFDLGNSRIRQFQEGVGLTTVAGAQVSTGAANGDVAATTTMNTTADSQPHRFNVDAATGDIYYPRSGGMLSRIVRATGLWEDLTNSGFGYGPAPSGLGNGHILLYTFHYSQTLGHINPSLSIVNLTDKSRTVIANPPANTVATNVFCAEGTTLKGSCIPMGYRNNAKHQGKYDVATGKWMSHDGDGNGRFVLVDFAGAGIMGADLVKVNRTIIGFDSDRNVGLSKNNIYACASNGLLYKYDLNNSNQETALPLPNTTFVCEGAVNYSPGRNSLFFIYKQNGLKGVAEYKL
ncbi:putative hemagglutinin/hemolysin-related protein [Bdellovibrio bacteriovorus str. Tiberius]|uniref:Putative hemagglutinin/hemolysin-related protein n=1 Tax=Bdellovibrio bacteriovorus str. Tiberius TaxID=1069642 RepID=K7ZA98_BDEBC|nr:putative hemagglutinin/hemolysin-related protein [Bdellovibrio bacteriovorus str. Tiberius]